MNSKLILEHLIRFQTVSDRPEEVLRAYDYIESLFEATSIVKERISRNGKTSLVLAPAGIDWKRASIVLNGHLDVIPAPEDAFVPFEKDGRMYGRGAADMKGGLAAILSAFAAILAADSHASLAVVITADEEIGGENGVAYLVEMGLQPGFALVADGPRTEGFVITTREKGALWLELNATGKSAHAARPWLGENAVEKLMGAVTAIQKYIGPHETDAWKSTCNVAFFETQNRTPNVVPDKATAVLDIRFTEELAKKPEELLNTIVAIAPDVELKALNKIAPLAPPKDDRSVRLLQDVFSKAVGAEVPLGYGHGASDARFFAERGIPTVLVGVIGANWHAEGEWVDLKSVETLTNVITEFLELSLLQ